MVTGTVQGVDREGGDGKGLAGEWVVESTAYTFLSEGTNPQVCTGTDERELERLLHTAVVQYGQCAIHV